MDKKPAKVGDQIEVQVGPTVFKGKVLRVEGPGKFDRIEFQDETNGTLWCRQCEARII